MGLLPIVPTFILEAMKQGLGAVPCGAIAGMRPRPPLQLKQMPLSRDNRRRV